MAQPKLLLLDLDGTLAVKWKPDLLPGRVQELTRMNIPVAIVTNQGGVHARYYWESRGESARANKYPTVDSILERLTTITESVPQIKRAYVAFYIGHEGYPLPKERHDVVQVLPTGVTVHGSWDPAWRKPAGGMLRQACADFQVHLHEALMVGDREYDREAAHNADHMPYLHVSIDPWEEGHLKRP